MHISNVGFHSEVINQISKYSKHMLAQLFSGSVPLGEIKSSPKCDKLMLYVFTINLILIKIY